MCGCFVFDPPGHRERVAEPVMARRRQQQEDAARGGQCASADGLRSGGAEGEQQRPPGGGTRLQPEQLSVICSFVHI